MGVFAPATTPAEAITRLNVEIGKLLRSPDFQARLGAVGFEPVGGSPAEAAAYLKTELVKWARVVKATGAKAE